MAHDVGTQETKKRQRSCIGCGQQAVKHAMFRIVRSSDGAVSLDLSGRAPGRGAYVCSSECFAAARKARKLDRALRCKLSEEDYQTIAGQLAGVGVEAETTEE